MIDLSSEIQGALDDANGDRDGATDLLIKALTLAAEGGDTVAQAALTSMTRRGARAHIDDFCRSHEGQVTMDAIKATVPAGKSIHRRNQDGRPLQLRLNFLDMEFDELFAKIRELASQRRRIGYSETVAKRYYELSEKVPSAKTPRAALDVLGLTSDAWLNESVSA